MPNDIASILDRDRKELLDLTYRKPSFKRTAQRKFVQKR